MSISKLDAIGGYALYKGGEVTHYTADGSILATGSLHGKLYHLNMQGKPPPGEMANLAKHKRPLTLDEWHRAYGHISIRAIQDLERKGMVTGLRIDANSKPSLTCVACIQGKAKHTPIPKFSSGGNHKKGDLTHSDLWGPARIKSLQQSLYYISFIDDATRLIRVRFLKDKSQAKVELQNYLTWVHTQLDRMPKTIRVDNGSEYINQELRAWCAERGIEITKNAPYSHAQHGNAERPNRTLMELARAMLIEKHLPLFLWQEAVRYAAYVRERAPTRALDSRTPYEMWNGKKPDVSHLREFGCDVWILTEEMKAQSKIEARAQRIVFVGFEDGPGAVRFYNASKRLIGVSRDAWFNENDAMARNVPDQDLDLSPLYMEGEKSESSPDPSMSTNDAAIEGETHSKDGDLAPSTTASSDEQPPSPPSANTPSTSYQFRAPKPADYRVMNNPSARPNETPAQQERPARLDDEEAHLARAELAEVALATLFDVPSSLNEAKALPESENWEKAMSKELKMLEERETWRLEKLPPGRSIVGCTWTFAKKFDADGNLSRYKARLVAQGFSQIPGQDFNDTFSPVMRLESFRNLVAMAALLNLEMGQMDITGAYLNGHLKEEIYMRQPTGFDDGTGRVCRLLRTLYGLKQSGREWNNRLNDYLVHKLGYTRFDNIDHCIYLRQRGDTFDFIAVWVDDLLFVCSSSNSLHIAKAEISSEFEATDQGDPRLLLGIEIHRNRTALEIKISQGQFLRKVLSRFGMEDCHPVTTPMENANHLAPATEDNLFDNPSLYRAAIGSLMYAAIGTRPDLAFSVQKLAQFSHAPSSEHWKAVKRVLRYVKGTLDLGIVYSGAENTSIIAEGYTDADWASDRIDRKTR